MVREVNPHDPTRYNEWYFQWQQRCTDACEWPNAYLMIPYLAGRFYSQDGWDGEPDWSSCGIYWTFRAHVVDIQETIQRLCDHCREQGSSWGTRWEPPDTWCAHDWKTKPQCPMYSQARHICHMLSVDPDMYPVEEW